MFFFLFPPNTDLRTPFTAGWVSDSFSCVSLSLLRRAETEPEGDLLPARLSAAVCQATHHEGLTARYLSTQNRLL